MLTLSSAYSATWSAAFGDESLRYNEKIWSVVTEYHEPEDTFFALTDHSDRTFFMIRKESIADLEGIDAESFELSIDEEISAKKFQAEWVGKSTKMIAGSVFTLLKYRIVNKFGAQVMVYAHLITANEATLLLLMWPPSLPESAAGLPTKLEALLAGLTLQIDA